MPGRPGGDGWRPGGAADAVHRRPSWANVNNVTVNNVHNRWQTAVTRPARPGWWNVAPARAGYWHGWADGVRTHWRYPYHNCFGSAWWGVHRHPIGGWHYYHGFYRRPWSYWWRAPTWAAAAGWFTWGAPAEIWTQPIYYDYGEGGNVVYQDDSVYIGGQEVATAEDFAATAADLATVDPPPDDAAAEAAEWMSLGTWAVTTDEQDLEPTQIIQLAVNKDGVVSGTLYNTQTDQAQTIEGRVDKETQRLAFRLGESENVVVETGLYNLTLDEAPALVHFGADRTETYLLVRLEQPEDGSALDQ